MKRLIDWIITPPYLLLFGTILVVFHPLVIIGYKISEGCFRNVRDVMNWCILKNIAITTGSSFHYSCNHTIPTDRPIMVVSNHESMYDIPMHLLQFRGRRPRFISKIELSRGIPSISFSVRHDGSALIDRKDRRQAIPEIQRVGRETEEQRGMVCIFPEGTRARDGVIKEFKPAGVLTLLKVMPNALIVPVAITGAWELLRWNFLPVPWGRRITYTMLAPVEPSSMPTNELVPYLEKLIREASADALSVDSPRVFQAGGAV